MCYVHTFMCTEYLSTCQEVKLVKEVNAQSDQGILFLFRYLLNTSGSRTNLKKFKIFKVVHQNPQRFGHKSFVSRKINPSTECVAFKLDEGTNDSTY